MSKLRKSARGQSCLVWLPGICNHSTETTVLAHLGGAGMGRKNPDLLAAFCCSSCHDVVDGRVSSWMEKDAVKACFAQGIFRTQLYWLETGLIKIN